MAPNLLIKAGFVRGDYDSSGEVTKCRIEFVLQNCYAHFVGNNCNFKPVLASNLKEKEVLMVFKELIEEYRDSYAIPIQLMTAQMTHVPMDMLPQILQSVSAELFCEGVNWSRIIGLFVFVGELAIQLVPNDESGEVVNKLYESFCRHVKETLNDWVEEHGSWEGVKSLQKGPALKIDTITSSDSDSNTTKSLEEGWYKNFANGAFRVVGSLVNQFANPRLQSYI